MKFWCGIVLALFLCGCSSNTGEDVDLVAEVSHREVSPEVSIDLATDERRTSEPLDFRVMTFNCGTTNQVLHKGLGGYTAEHGDLIDAAYRNNLAWAPAEEALQQFIAAQEPQVVVLQEVYYDGWCATDDLELPSGLDMVCDGYDKDGPLQIRRLLGDQYHAACAWHFADLCVGVRKDFGQLAACQDEVCIDALPGTPVEGCSSSARVARAEIDLAGGGELTVVAVHTNAGMSYDDQECRGKQFAQVFEDSGDGAPAASGTANLAMGDMNTDPFAFAGADSSLDVWNKYVGAGKPFHYVSADSYDDPFTHVTFMHLDHVISDSIIGECLVYGESPGTQPVMDSSFFDHRPVVCDVTLPLDGGVSE